MALGTLFSSERTGWAPPGPGALAAPLLAEDAVLPPAAEVLLADAKRRQKQRPQIVVGRREHGARVVATKGLAGERARRVRVVDRDRSRPAACDVHDHPRWCA